MEAPQFIARVLVITLIMLNVVVFLTHSARTIFYPYPVNFSEGQTLGLSILLQQKGNYFFDINDLPFMHGAYPPVYPLIVLFFINIFGVTLTIGRIISFLSTIFIIFILFKIFNKAHQDKIHSFIVSLMFIAPFFVMRWSSTVRVDLLAIFFSFVGLYIYYFYYKKSYWRFLSIVFFILAFYTKQNAIAAPLSILIYNIIEDRKEFKKILLLYLAPLLSIFLLLNYLTIGQFYLHIITYTKFIPIQVFSIFSNYQFFIRMFSVFLLILFFNKDLLKKYNIFTIYFLINFFFLFTISKPGSDSHYMIEPFLSLLVISGLIIIHWIKMSKNMPYYKYLFPILLLQIFLMAPFDVYSSILRSPLVPEGHDGRTIINYYVKNAHGLVLSEDLGYLAINNLPIIYETYQFAWMNKMGLWDSTKLIEYCENKKFSMMILRGDILGVKGMEGCIIENYNLIKEVDTIESFSRPMRIKIYLPKNSI